MKKPSEFYTGIVTTLEAKFEEKVEVLSYAEFGTNNVKGIQVYIEIPRFIPAKRHADGRRALNVEIEIHCIVSKSYENAALEVMDLAGDVESLLDVSSKGAGRWGFGQSVELPESVDAQEGLFKSGESGYEGWVVSFKQTIYLGDEAILEETRGGVRLAVNPIDENNPAEYKSIGG